MSNCITRHVPNTLTCLNLFSGCVACVVAFHGSFLGALFFVLLSALFDFLDGLMARLLHAPSPIGKDLDSLADEVSFGVAPSVIVYSLFKEMTYDGPLESLAAGFPYLAFLIAVFSALRLAKFNNDARQTVSFVGLPVPAHALFWASLVAGLHDRLTAVHPLLLLLAVCLSSALLVAELPMFSLKLKSLAWRDNQTRYLFLLVSIPLLVCFRIAGFAAVVVWYVLLSLLTVKRS